MMRPLSIKARAAALALMIPAVTVVPVARGEAQEVRGVVYRADGVTPAAGVVAVLMHATRSDSIIARTVTNERGRFTLGSRTPFTATLRLLRVGFQPMNAGSFELAVGDSRDVSVTLNEMRIELATRTVRSSSRCEIRPDGANTVAQLFQQARTALIATTTTIEGNVRAEYVNYQRMHDRRQELLSPVARATRTSGTLKPYASASVDSLERRGYVVESGTDFVYYAPDADVLLSDRFLSQHCLQYVEKHESLPQLVGVAFKPVVARPNFVDIQGTLWLDRATSELQFLDYSYTSLPDHLERAGLGGRVDYAQMANGVWFVSEWSIRMPIVREQAAAPATFGGFRAPAQLISAGQQVAGGVVRTIRDSDRTLYLNAGAESAGSLPGDRAPSAGISMIAEQDSLMLKSMIRSTCATQRSGYTGLARGMVSDHRSQPYEGATITAHWKDDFRLNGTSGNATWSTRTLTAVSYARGVYAMCGLPIERTFSIAATRNAEERGRLTNVKLWPQSPVVQLDLRLEPPSR
ncbi:MAG: carboxypeptidase-like regulatory domain-containing protein [Gemmatimonas sp.]